MRIAMSQFAADPNPERNLDHIRETIRQSGDASIVVFPEATMACFGIPLGPIAEPLDGPWATTVRELAEGSGKLVVAGMFTPSPDGRVTNTLLITGRGVDTYYDKIHLFDAFGFTESATVAPGERIVVSEVDDVTVGFATCYDIRFPGLFQRLADEGAVITIVPASWGSGPGKREQWELLARARALDSTTWIVACGQADPTTVGRKPSKAPTGIGYSLVASPLGEIRAQLGPEPGLRIVDVDTSEVTEARKIVPVLANRKF
ncbi:carbon-nitrogen hydrolase family protein [Kibdelosporangium philippinense]|uniref:Carbon-nitrogen hydrolase family protein n=1 Tax=Kibdelosporangium philippinense TaxID=211113 RepID=A0ABS8ZP64_9PSEU|nr:carbon-nitrogen hydrolase family protein [Kibdelosporangium philippinense]MCE7009377.1 carbon-nitrogen hydrolase family protein [Kibdelosporangium philippinense]